MWASSCSSTLWRRSVLPPARRFGHEDHRPPEPRNNGTHAAGTDANLHFARDSQPFAQRVDLNLPRCRSRLRATYRERRCQPSESKPQGRTPEPRGPGHAVLSVARVSKVPGRAWGACGAGGESARLTWALRCRLRSLRPPHATSALQSREALQAIQAPQISA